MNEGVRIRMSLDIPALCELELGRLDAVAGGRSDGRPSSSRFPQVLLNRSDQILFGIYYYVVYLI